MIFVLLVYKCCVEKIDEKAERVNIIEDGWSIEEGIAFFNLPTAKRSMRRGCVPRGTCRGEELHDSSALVSIQHSK